MLQISSVLWTISIGFFSVFNDIIVKRLLATPSMCKISSSYNSVIILLFQSYLSFLLLILFTTFYNMLFKKDNRNIKNPILDYRHAVRAFITFIGFVTYRECLKNAALLEMQVLGFCIPLFSTVLAAIFLKERSHWSNHLLSLVGGVLVLNAIAIDTAHHLYPISFVLAFAVAEVYIKYMFTKKSYSFIEMLYSFYYYTIIFSFFYLWYLGGLEGLGELILFFTRDTAPYIFFLILGDLLIQISLYKSFQSADMSITLPFRFSVLIIAYLADKIMLKQNEFKITSVIGILLINIISFFLQKYTNNKEKDLQQFTK